MKPSYVSSMTCRFLLNADLDSFVNRIAYHTQLIYLEHFYTEEGFVQLQTPELTHRDGLPSLCILGRYFTWTLSKGYLSGIPGHNMSSAWIVKARPRTGNLVYKRVEITVEQHNTGHR